MKVELQKLKQLCNLLIDRAQESGFQEIEIDVDNYWIIVSDDRENFSTNSPNICVGSLIDDIESLQKILDGTNQPTPVDFDRLASLLLAVGERISRSNKVY